MAFVSELQRRNVFRVAAAYLVVGWLLTEVLTSILPTMGAPEWIANAVIWIFALGFVPTLVLAWVFEITPDGLRTQASLDKEGHQRQRQGSRLDYLTIAGIIVLVVFAGFFSASRTGPDIDAGSDAVSAKSLAVLPFENLSGDPGNDYFSDGLTETLLNILVKQLPELQVAARTSSFAFKESNVDVREIARTLKVAHVLEGSVQLAGDQVRVTAQLIRAVDGFHVWSQSYDRTLDDIFAIQDEIADEVGAALSVTLLGAVPEPRVSDPASLTAYDLFLLARSERSTYSYGGLEAAERYLKAALRVDPEYNEAKTELALNYLYQQQTGLMETEDAFAMASALAEQVVDAEPTNVTGRAIQLFLSALPGSVEANPEDTFSAIARLRDLVAEYPGDYESRSLLTAILSLLQRFEEALLLQLEALDRDPLNARIWFEVGSLYLNLEDMDEARTALNRSLELEPNQPNAHAKLATVAMQTGDGVEYVRQMLEAMRDDPRDTEMPAEIAGFLYRIELVEEADDFHSLVDSAAPTSDLAYLLDMLRGVAVADAEATQEAARRAIEDDVGMRGNAFGVAVEQLLLTARREGGLEEAVSWLDAAAPGLFDVDAEALPPKYRGAQPLLIDTWFVTEPEEEVRRRVGLIKSRVKSFGIDPLQNPNMRLGLLALNGETEQAIDVALAEIFSEPVTAHLNYPDKLARSFLESVVVDPQVTAAIAEWEDDKARLRRDLAVFLADVEA
jgi:TolB-like protein/Flp pilus assembly protein TadD